MLEPVRPKGPPLNSLRAFESAARLGGFAAAANELCVTPGAITQHIKTLETWVGAALFERHSKGVVLTPLGESTLREFSLAFDQLGAAVQSLRSRATPTTIRIAALPSVAQLWLSPRLQAIHEVLPDIKISIVAMEYPPNLLREAFDISLFFVEPPLPANAIKVCDDEIFPVCAPAIAERIREPSDLANFPLLQDTTLTDDWRRWLSRVEPDANLALTGPSYSLFSLAVDEARNGAGVLIGHAPLVQRDIDAGTLVAPFEARIRIPSVLALTTANPIGESQILESVARVLLCD